MSAPDYKNLLGQIGGAALASLGQALLQADYAALGAWKPAAQAGALLFNELAASLAAKWAPAAAPATPPASTGAS